MGVGGYIPQLPHLLGGTTEACCTQPPRGPQQDKVAVIHNSHVIINMCLCWLPSLPCLTSPFPYQYFLGLLPNKLLASISHLKVCLLGAPCSYHPENVFSDIHGYLCPTNLKNERSHNWEWGNKNGLGALFSKYISHSPIGSVGRHTLHIIINIISLLNHSSVKHFHNETPWPIRAWENGVESRPQHRHW